MNSQMNRQALLLARKQIQEKIAEIFAPREYEPVNDPELMIYGGGFFDERDKALMADVHNTVPEELGQHTWTFKDKRLPEMLFRFRARNYPETLSPDEQAQWLEHCRSRLSNGESGHLSFSGFFEEIEQIQNEMELDEQKTEILNEVEQFGRELEAYLNSN